MEKCKEIARINYDESYFEYLDKIVPMQDKLVRLEKLLLIAVSAGTQDDLNVSFEDYYDVENKYDYYYICTYSTICSVCVFVQIEYNKFKNMLKSGLEIFVLS